MIGIVAQLVTFLRSMLGDPHAAETIAHHSHNEVNRLIDPSASPTGRALLFDTATKHAIAHLRRRRAQLADRGSTDSVGSAPGVEDAAEPVGIRHLEVMQNFAYHLNEVMQQLPEPTKQIYRLRHADRLTVAQIAERVNLAVDLVEQQLKHAGVLCVSELEKRGIHSLDPEPQRDHSSSVGTGRSEVNRLTPI